MFFESWNSLLRVAVSGVVGYAALVLILRSSGKRTLSKMNAFDFVVTVALGSSFATLLLSKQVPLADGLLAFALLAGLQFVVTWASVRSERIDRLVKAQPTLIFHRGAFQEGTLRRQRVTHTEVRQALREQGFGSLDEVEAIVLETNGELSVLGSAPAGRQGALADVRS